MMRSITGRTAVAVLLACVAADPVGGRIHTRAFRGLGIFGPSTQSWMPGEEPMFSDDDDFQPDLRPRLKTLLQFQKTVRDDMGPEAFRLVDNCTQAVIQQMKGLVNESSSDHSQPLPLFSSATELFDSWALYIGDPGNYGSCYRGGNLYCAVESNHSGYKAWSGICVPPPCTVDQIMAITKATKTKRNKNPGVVVSSVSCYPFVNEITWKASVVIFLCLCLVMLVLAATALDLLADERPKLFKRRHRALPSHEYEQRQLLAARGPSVNSDHPDHNIDDGGITPADTQDCGCEDDRDHFRSKLSLFNVIRCFSFKRSWELMTSSRKECSRGLRIFDGIRVLSILWIVLGQMLMIQAKLYANTLYVVREVQTGSWHIILMGTLATDTFLFMGGFFACYRVLHVFAFQGHAPHGMGAVKASLKLLLRRYFRLTPLLGLVLMFYTQALPSLIGGPIWSRWLVHPEFDQCNTTWWSVLTYSNNLIDTSCMEWTWYTAVDMQLFVLVPILTLAFWHFGLVAVCSVLALTIGSAVSNAVGVVGMNLTECSNDVLNFTLPLEEHDQKPWFRAVPYLLGILLAFMYNAMGEFEGANNFRTKPGVKLVIGLVTAAALAAPAFGSMRMRYQSDSKFGTCRWSRRQNEVFLSLYRVSWSVGIFLLIGCCLVGWCSWISKLLSARAWTSFSRLSYGVFLVHPVLIEIRAFGGDTFIDFSSLSYALDAAGFILLSFTVSCGLFLLVEGPMYQLRQLSR